MLDIQIIAKKMQLENIWHMQNICRHVCFSRGGWADLVQSGSCKGFFPHNLHTLWIFIPLARVTFG